ncbi:protein phosphatase 2C domain-containing protein [Fulvivirga sp. 29W222]|uniref:Protein phosphatase 2C domain-containing protein n=1 Tax=Fulvivirga marina TaxID=2494733 RepID=A0A937FUM0_9BACT|nr:protein phosphatase 2C domain-containing protein [Fulvivirga marina]MBL6444698.1 protein phosphatase 2C domain-containing protein [Fulvivirga marina]
MKSWSFSHIGKRKVNEDVVIAQAFENNTSLIAVVDGMGGYDYGDMAASVVAENITTYLSTVTEPNPYHIQKAVNKANLALRQKREALSLKMGATIGGVIIIGGNSAICFWVGDVKIFHFRNRRLVFESHPHTLVNQLVSQEPPISVSSLSRYRHIVTRSVHGDLEYSQAEIYNIARVQRSDLFIVCSDGVHDLIDGLYLEKQLSITIDLNELLSQIECKLLNEAKDNYSLVTASFNRDNLHNKN